MAIRAGFVGLGNIGEPMAQQLVKGGLETTVFDVHPPALKTLVEAGAKAASSLRELASRCDVIGVCVRDDADVRAVTLGDAGLVANAAPEAVIAILLEHPKLMQRPIVVRGERAVIGRPSDRVRDLL